MKVFEYSKENDMTNAEVKEKFGLPSHLSVIPPEMLDGDDAVTSADFDENIEVEVEEEVKDLPEEIKQNEELVSVARSLRTGIGDKTKRYLEFVEENKSAMPTEYNRVKALIERYL